uniref:Polypeptide-transport-associated ShlB-type domain-containing protein n=1 Tax=Phenylobacterium glaciei TaxID=2803784 RepID=A0A974P4U5_9CAUL|nr:hypothetical protein JKL49_09050 [Phenylobacterium glaciei]
MLIAAGMFLSLPVFAWPQDEATPEAACGKPDSGCFQLNAVSLEGLTVYKPGDLAPLYQAYLTREVSTADLVTIATAITDKYRADGYFLSAPWFRLRRLGPGSRGSGSMRAISAPWT